VSSGINGTVAARFPEDLSTKEPKMATTMVQDKKFSTVPLDWKEVYYTNCPLVSASNVDQELGVGSWARIAFPVERRASSWLVPRKMSERPSLRP
jgi:hypothetical protein